MLDLGWQEFMLIAVVAVIIVGPKDLPKVVRTVSHWIRKARGMANEFQRSLEEVARESELDDLRKQAQSITRGDLSDSLKKTVDADGEIEKSLREAKESSGVDDAYAEARQVAEQTRSYVNSADVPPEADPTGGTAAGGDKSTGDGSSGDRSIGDKSADGRAAASDTAASASSRAATASDDEAGNGKTVRSRGVPRPVRPEDGTPASVAEA